jgi:hypothetical protein
VALEYYRGVMRGSRRGMTWLCVDEEVDRLYVREGDEEGDGEVIRYIETWE